MVALTSQIVPLARTYHASCLVGRFMIVLGGEAALLADLQDVWALDLETARWTQLTFTNMEAFHAKRFHTASAVSQNRVVSFGGCHSEYIHLNDVNIFDLSGFISKGDPHITCEKVNFGNQKVPSSRWGHTASVYQD